ncbi:MAG: 5'/3'-nucleotidase SurE [Conexivisphaerales archaeon]
MILISNDDGPASPGLKSLIKALSKIDEVTFFIPEGPRSGSSMSLTFHKPLRVREIEVENIKGHIVSGSPADAVLLANIMLDKKPSVVATGINLGDNSGLQDIYTSGTVAGAVQGALLGYPAVAFSKMTSDENILFPWTESTEFQEAANTAAKIIKFVLDRGLPSNVHLLNVNFPVEVTQLTKASINRASFAKYKHYIDRRLDPRGREYLWLWGNRTGSYPEGTDTHALYDANEISITPMTIDMSSVMVQGDMSSWIKDLIERV